MLLDMILFLGANCPQCEALKRRVDLTAVPVLTIIHTDSPDGLAESDFYDVLAVPTLVLDGGKLVTDMEAIVAQLKAT